LHERFADNGFTVIGVAMDVQGVSAAKPWYQKHKITFPALVDPANVLGRTLGFRIVPNQFFVDELGTFRGRIKKSELEDLLAKPIQPVPPGLKQQLQAAAPQPGLQSLIATAKNRPNDFDAQLAAGQAALKTANDAAVELLTAAVTLDRSSVEAWTTLAAAHLAVGDKPAAAKALRIALKLDPKNWLIHKQIWALEHPDRFYDGRVDFRWQREQLRREAKAQP